MARSSTSVDVAVIGAGPYLSLAAHLRARDVEHRIFGELMGSWKHNMRPGMLLKSYGTYHPAHHLARHLSAVLARFQPEPWVPSYDPKALP